MAVHVTLYRGAASRNDLLPPDALDSYPPALMAFPADILPTVPTYSYQPGNDYIHLTYTGAGGAQHSHEIYFQDLIPQGAETDVAERLRDAPLRAVHLTVEDTSAPAGGLSVIMTFVSDPPTLSDYLTLRLDDVLAMATSLNGESLLPPAGSETLLGTEEDDMIFGGAGDDDITLGTGNDTGFGGADDDLLRGGTGTDLIGGGWGHDTLFGEGDDDAVFGGGGNDWLWGGDGADLLGGGWGEDQLDGGTGDDRLWGAGGDDTVMGQDGADVLGGGTDSDVLEGGDGDDTLYGGDGADRLSGGTGNDALAGGAGDDTLTGSAGNDTFVFYGRLGSDTDVITDFEDGIDTIQIYGVTGRDFANLTLTATTQGGVAGVEVAFNTSTIFVEGATTASLTAADFDLL